MTESSEDNQRTSSPTHPSASSESDRKWSRGTQIAVIAGPLVTLIIFAATLLIDALGPQKSSEESSPTDVPPTDTGMSLPTESAPPSMPDTEPVTEPEEIVQIEPRETIRTEAEETNPTEPEEFVQTETRERIVNKSFRNEHCEDPTNVRWEVRAAEGWEIDVTSLFLIPSASSKSTYYGISDLTKDGFTIAGSVSNIGDCVTVLGQVVARDKRGNLSVLGTYNEVREVVDPS